MSFDHQKRLAQLKSHHRHESQLAIGSQERAPS